MFQRLNCSGIAKQVWLHLNTAGANGNVANVCVLLPESMQRYILPSDEYDEKASIIASMRFLDVAPRHITIPLLAAIYRSALCHSDISIAIVGPSGARKTAMAALMQQHFGAGMVATRLPANWTSTANALELQAFKTKDAIMVIDEYVPGDGVTARMLQTMAERLIRGAANGSARGRLTDTITERASKPPRGMLVMTGEDSPSGQSLNARLFPVHIERDAVEVEALTRCQEDAANGVYAQAMATYLKHSASFAGELQSDVGYEGVIRHMRTEFSEQTGGHGRVSDNMLKLLLGLKQFIHVAVAVGAMNDAEALKWWEQGVVVMSQHAAEQQDEAVERSVSERYISLLISVLTSGNYHLGELSGQDIQQKDIIGWRADKEVWLEPNLAYAAVCKMADDSKQPFGFNQTMAHKHLRSDGFLMTEKTSDGQDRLTCRRQVGSLRKRVLVLDGSKVPNPLDDLPF